MSTYFLIYLVSLIVSIIVMYHVIKGAVYSAIKSYNETRHSGSDLEVRLIKLIAEIAKQGGLDQDKVEEILSGESTNDSIKDFLKE